MATATSLSSPLAQGEGLVSFVASSSLSGASLSRKSCKNPSSTKCLPKIVAVAAPPRPQARSPASNGSRLSFWKPTQPSLVTVKQGHGSSKIVCMAHPRRVQMVAQQIKREIGDMLIKDKVLQHAILPETAVGADMYLTSLATVSDVVLSKDLQVAKVYISICSDERGKEIVMEGLKAKTKHVRAGLGKRMQLRLTPEVRFIMDDSLERGSRVLAILDRLKKEREERESRDGSTDAREDNDDDDNWEDIQQDGKPVTTTQATGSSSKDADDVDDDNWEDFVEDGKA